jgi:hypothetical protein
MDEHRGMFPGIIFSVSHKPFQIVNVDRFIHIFSAAYIFTGCRTDPSNAQGHRVMLLDHPEGVVKATFGNEAQISRDIDLGWACGLTGGGTMVELIPVEDFFALGDEPHYMFRAEPFADTTTRTAVVVDLRKIDSIHLKGVKGAASRTSPKTEASVFATTGPLTEHERCTAILYTDVVEELRIIIAPTTASPLYKFYLPVFHRKAHDFCHFLRTLGPAHNTDVGLCLPGHDCNSGCTAARIAATAAVGARQSIFHQFNSGVHVHVKDF